MSILEIFLLSLLISFIAVETYWWGGAIYIARPVFAGPLIGLIMGDLQTGLIVGGSVELVFLGGLAMGAYSPPNAYIGGMVGTAFAVMSGGNLEIGIALAYPIGVLVQMVNYLVTNINIVWVERAEKCYNEGKIKQAELFHYASIITRMIVQFFLPTFIALLIGSAAIESFYSSIPAWFSNGLKISAGILPAIGMASIVNTLGFKKGWPYFLGGFVLATYLNMNIMAIALLSLAVAVVMGTIGKSNADSLSFNFSADKSQGILDNKTLRSIFFRSFTSMGSFNYKGYNNIGYVYSIAPALKKIYADNKEAYQESLSRNCEFFNSHPYFSNLVMGVSVALEEQKSKDESVTGASITATKTALMGPLAGIGDSVFQGTYRTIFSAIGAGLCMAGNVLGCFVYLIPQIILAWGTRWAFLKYAYIYGTELVVKLKTSNLFDKFVEGANIVGMMVIAAMTSSFVSIALKPAWTLGGKEIVLQAVFDSILPKFLPLACMLMFYQIMAKKKNGIYICLALSFVIGFAGVIIGLL
ncbi:MAG: hypothetical protein APF77_23600 [Clostridia bacterium BRH_c25]|nr:MAG: hypothetical protein APF77_23600 [Clostridia bacterium BRH_c25]